MFFGLVTSSLRGDVCPDSIVFVFRRVLVYYRQNAPSVLPQSHAAAMIHFVSCEGPVIKSTEWIPYHTVSGFSIASWQSAFRQLCASYKLHGCMLLRTRERKDLNTALDSHGRNISTTALKVRKDIYCKRNFSLSWR